MASLGQINRAGYQVNFQWECEFDDSGIETPEMLAHPTVCKNPLCTRDAVCGGRTEAMRLHYKAWEGETIQNVDVMSHYPYICKNFTFSVGHSFINVGDACKDKEACFRKYGLIKCQSFHQRGCIIPCSPSEPIRNSCSV